MSLPSIPHPDILHVEQLRDPDSEVSGRQEVKMDHQQFLQNQQTVGRRLSLRSSREELVQKNIIKENQVSDSSADSNLQQTQERLATLAILARRLSYRPTALDLKLRNILKVDSADNVGNSSVQKNIDIKSTKRSLKSCLKKRLVDGETGSMVVIGDSSVQGSMVDVGNDQGSAFDLDKGLGERRNLSFHDLVQVFPTFKKNEYNRKPDDDSTFRKLTPSMKVQIREELNHFKRNEMEVHESSSQNTCFH